MKLSIFLAGIRPSNWSKLYSSIPNVTTLPKDEYELLFVSPYDLPLELQNVDNVNHVKDWGNPSRCFQLGLLHSRGEYVVWGADDGTFSPTMAFDKAFDAIPKHHKGVVSFKYKEGNTPQSEAMLGDEYWILGSHKLHRKLKHVPNNCTLVMNALIRRDYFMEIGGWDCRIEQLGLSCPDLSVRLQKDGAEVIMGEKFMEVSHLFADAGDHGPITRAFKKHDKPLYCHIYSNPEGENRSRIDFDNWKNAESVWSRRFKK